MKTKMRLLKERKQMLILMTEMIGDISGRIKEITAEMERATAEEDTDLADKLDEENQFLWVQVNYLGGCVQGIAWTQSISSNQELIMADYESLRNKTKRSPKRKDPLG